MSNLHLFLVKLAKMLSLKQPYVLKSTLGQNQSLNRPANVLNVQKKVSSDDYEIFLMSFGAYLSLEIRNQVAH